MKPEEVKKFIKDKTIEDVRVEHDYEFDTCMLYFEDGSFLKIQSQLCSYDMSGLRFSNEEI